MLFCLCGNDNGDAAEVADGLQIIGQWFGADADAAAAARGVQQVCAPVDADGKTDVRIVQSVDGGGDGDDGAFGNFVVDGGHCLFRYDGDGMLGGGCFVAAYAVGQGGVVAQLAVAVAVRGHKVDSFGGDFSAERVGDVAHDAVLFVVANPFGEVVQPRGESVDLSVAIAYVAQFAGQGVDGGAVGAPQGQHGFDKGLAVEACEVDDERFEVVVVEGVCRVGRADKRFCDVGNGRLLICKGIVQAFDDGGVGGRLRNEQQRYE